MSNSGAGKDRPVWLPPADLDQRSIPRHRQPARTWFRVHAENDPALSFRLAAHHRFSHSDSPHKLLYVGSDPATCLWERFGDDAFRGCRALSRRLWAETVLSQIHVPEIHVCDLASAALRTVLTVDRASLMTHDFTVTQAWGLAIQRHPARFQGIRSSSRFIDRPCLALFDADDFAARLKATVLGGLADSQAATEWLERYKIAMI